MEKLHDRRRERLGLEKLSYIDEGVYFKDGNPKPTGTPEEILAAGSGCTASFPWKQRNSLIL